ncbi:MAG TPA: hypothetical protein PL037_05325, partial [Elusimicrobiales bacterium]|nr:hypothetical protein [Elusimicrobiales bacterium]
MIRMSSLGDIILAAPVLRNLRRRWPDARITMLVKPQFAAAAARCPFLSDVVPFLGILSTVRAVRAGRYDLLLDLHANPRSRLISALSGAGRRIRYRKDSLARRLFVNLRVPSPALEKHTMERYLDVLEAAGVPAVYTRPEPGDWVVEAGDPPAEKRAGRLCLLQTA